MFNFIKTLWKPEAYHNYNFKKIFFEGWYFKSVSIKHNNKLAIIPGIFKNKVKKKDFAFIQFLNPNKNKSYFIEFSENLFKSEQNKFNLIIENSYFSLNELQIDIKRDNFRAFGHLKFSEVNSWPVTLFSPGAMGWYSFVPFMECYHGILSFNHIVSGKILLNEEIFIFTNDKGYIEKDWGSSFPESYIWMQSNNFDDPSISFTLSVAKIPWLFKSFLGVLGAVYFEGKLIPFTTYNNTKIKKLEQTNDNIKIILENDNYILEISANNIENPGGLLKAPYYEDMLTRVNESMNSDINLILKKKIGKNTKTIIIDKGLHSGLEIVGNIKSL